MYIINGGGAQDRSVMNVNRTMLRFRPIAPKPSAGGVEVLESKNMAGLRSRTKRKYVRVRRNSGYRRSKKDSPGQGQDDGSGKEIVTLQLLPEKSDRVVEVEVEEGEEEERWWCSIDGTVKSSSSRVGGVGTGPPTWTVDSEGCRATDLTGHRGDETRVVESWVTVECVTDACNNTTEGHVARGMGVDRVMKILEEDTCPGMISDGQNRRVEWVNGAYRRMVRQGNDRQLRVGLVVREKLPSVSEFSCRVRVQYHYTNRRIMNRDQWSQIVVPCDVLKINGGGFAWRLDIEAALSLGR